jgi:hypothetical protein
MYPDSAGKRKQTFWKTPRNQYIILGIFLAVVAVVSGVAGLEFGQTLAQQTRSIPIIFQPGSLQVVPVTSTE